MKTPLQALSYVLGVTAMLCGTASATVQITAFTPSVQSPQKIGTVVTWTATAMDTNIQGPVLFRFNVTPPHGQKGLIKDYNIGTLNSETWTAQPFVWVPTGLEGAYDIQVIAKDFGSGEYGAKTVRFRVTPLVSGSTPVVVATAHPLVALFSAPSCPTGSFMRVSFQQEGGATPATTTNWAKCHPPESMTFEIGGMYPSTGYQMFSQTRTGKTTTNSQPLTFTTGALPNSMSFPTFKVLTAAGAQTDTAEGILMHGVSTLASSVNYPDTATDLNGKILWYYATSSSSHANILTRPLKNGTILSIENGPVWNNNIQAAQILRQLDLAGNIIKETNSSIIQQQLTAMGSTNGGSCAAIAKPAPLGAACLGSFHHDFIQTLPNGYSAVLADIEKIFPPGTQGDTSGLPVDIIGDMIIVLDRNFQVAWYFDTFEHDGGAPQLNIARPAVLGEFCTQGKSGCPPMYLLSKGIAPNAHDWLHANTIYYWPAPQNGNATGGDLIWSSRHQDWVMRVDYRDGKGTGNILWRMGPGGDFTITSSDPWPWFSHQHDVGIENGGTGPMTIFDNGNTRVSAPGVSTGGTPGLGSNCGPNDCGSRGMVVTFDESTKVVTPVLSQDLGEYGTAMGSAQELSNGSYFFVPTIVIVNANHINEYDMEILPSAGSLTGPVVLNVEGPEVYRDWRLPSLYDPPTT